MKVICPKCLEAAAVSLDLTDGDTISCGACEEAYSAAVVRELVAGWSRLLPVIAAVQAATPRTEGGK